jgi:HlyD family secretion protein
MKKAVIALVVAALIGTVAVLYLRGRQAPSADGGLTLYGNVDIREVQLAFRQSGRLIRMACDEGDSVKAGQLLAELDAQPFQEAVAAAEADVALAQADLTKLRNGNRPLEIAQAEDAERQAQATFLNADQEYQRTAKLHELGILPTANLDAARAVRDQAAAALAAAQHALALIREGARAEDLAAGEARLAGAAARLSQARTALGDAQLVSPADAVVLTRVREPGSMVHAADPVCTLSLQNPVYVRAYVGERQLGRVAPGTPVVVTTDGGPKAYHGQVGFVSPRAEFTPKSVETADLRTDLVYRLRLVIADGDAGLRQGMPVTVTVGPAVANR